MDDGLSAAVRKVFVTLHKQGLIYRDKRLVNWDPKLLTAISDLEVVQKEVKGHYWHFKYPIEGKEGELITVATTRPETMLGDTGVAVHPDDERYKDLIGQYCILPIVGRRIKSLPMNMPILKRDRAPLKSPQRMISTTLKSANAMISKKSTSWMIMRASMMTRRKNIVVWIGSRHAN